MYNMVISWNIHSWSKFAYTANKNLKKLLNLQTFFQQNDPVSRHKFYCGDLQHSVENGWFFYANYVGQLNVVGHQYECVTKFGISDSDYDIMRPYIANGDLFVIDKDANERVLYQLLLDAEGGKNVNIYEVFSSVARLAESPVQ